MPNPRRRLLPAAAALMLVASFAFAGPASAGVAAAPKVVIIVGPTGSQTDSYRSSADGIASAAESAGAQVVKVYSPNATWANVRAAVDGANIIVYLGHGNGYPNPYSSGAEPTDRDNGWGLNVTTTRGDGDTFNIADPGQGSMVYCGEDALLGTLSSSNPRYPYCAGAIHPAPGFVMIYNKACYAPGASEGWDTKATESVAVQHVRNFSYPVLALGASAYFATDLYQGATGLVQSIIANPNATFGETAQGAPGYDAEAHRSFAHPDISGAEIWVQKTGNHGGDMDYWYAYAGNPDLTPYQAGFGLPFSDIGSSPFRNDILWLADQAITSGCAPSQYCPMGVVTRAQMASFLVRALGLTSGGDANLFDDDNGLIYEADINRLATAGITSGCDVRQFCPDQPVTRAQMASFLVRALDLTTGAGTDAFDDDNGLIHEKNINILATATITSGCGPRLYCPAGTVTRGQMAAFLHRAFAGS